MPASAVARHQGGMGLIEILVSLLIVAVSLLGLAALQGKAQRAEMESYQRSQALFLLQDMAARLRTNRAGAMAGLYGDHATQCARCPGVRTTMAASDLCHWVGALEGMSETLSGQAVGAMLNGCGCISGSGHEHMITVAWQGLYEIRRASANPCGSSLILDATRRRTVSIPVRFFDIGG